MSRKSIALVSGFVALVVVIGVLMAGTFHPAKAAVARGDSAAHANKVAVDDQSLALLSGPVTAGTSNSAAIAASDDRGRLLDGVQQKSNATAYANKVAVDDQIQLSHSMSGLAIAATFTNKVVVEDRSELNLSKVLPSKALAYAMKVAVDDQAQSQGTSQDVAPANAISGLSANAVLAESARDTGLAIQAYKQTKDSRSLPSCIPADVLAQLPSVMTQTTRTASVPTCGELGTVAVSSTISGLSANGVLAESTRDTGLAIQAYERTKDSRFLPSCIPADVLAQLPSVVAQTTRTALVPTCGTLEATAASNPIPNGTYAHEFYQLTLDGNRYVVNTTMGQAWTEGRFTLSGDQMALTETLQAECAAGENSSVYQWVFDGKGLTFTPVSDTCSSRVFEMTNGPWVYQGPAS
jgi:type II secretory pathway component PulM